VQGKDIRLCTKSYSSQEVEAMQLDSKLAEVTNAQKKQRVEDQSDPLLDPGTSSQTAPASQRSGTSQQPRIPASALARTHTSLPAQRQLTLSGSLLPQRQLTLPSMAIAERHNKANLQLGMLFYGYATCHAVLRLSVHCRAWLRLGLASSLSPTTLCVAVCWWCAMGTLLQQNLVSGGVKRRGR